MAITNWNGHVTFDFGLNFECRMSWSYLRVYEYVQKSIYFYTAVYRRKKNHLFIKIRRVSLYNRMRTLKVDLHSVCCLLTNRGRNEIKRKYEKETGIKRQRKGHHWPDIPSSSLVNISVTQNLSATSQMY